MRAAVISGNVVDNVVMIEDAKLASADLKMPVIELPDDSPVGIGWFYDSSLGVFNPPIQPEA